MSEQKNTNSHIAGNTLISITFFMLALALIGKPAIDFYDAWKDKTATARTNERLEAVNKAVRNFVVAKGRYPCPALMTAQFDTADFGKEVETCATSPTGLDSSVGQEGRAVVAGAVPVRTLGLPDDTIYDGYNHRYIYTVTSAFAAPDPDMKSTKGGIRMIDDNGLIATREEGNIIFAVTSLGNDMAGAHNRNGIQIADCDDEDARSYENCNMDATLVNTVIKSDVETNQKFTQTTRFKSQDICENVGEPPPAEIAYLLDTSGSMDSAAVCPPGYTGPCNRMDAAHWALRRAIPARQAAALEDDTLTTDFTGFTGMNGSPLISANLSVGPEQDVESLLNPSPNPLCPKGNTPLTEHIWALAERLGPGESVDRPNVIMVVSDGYNNGEGVNTKKQTTLKIAQDINTKYDGRIVINIIDLGDNEAGLRPVAEASNASAPEKRRGKYFKTSSPTELLDWMLTVSGSCGDTKMDEPEDHRYCPFKP